MIADPLRGAATCKRASIRKPEPIGRERHRGAERCASQSCSSSTFQYETSAIEKKGNHSR